jgi:hypothetical protein
VTDVSSYGITARLPRGWDARIAKRPDPAGDPAGPSTRAAPEEGISTRSAPAEGDPPGPLAGTEHPVAHLANFPLPPVRGDYGSGAVELMRADDIFVALVEFEPEAASTPLFSHRGIPRFGVNDFSPHTMQRTIAGMCGAQAFFNRNGRAFCLYVVLGSHALRAPLVAQVNALLAGLEIDPL